MEDITKCEPKKKISVSAVSFSIVAFGVVIYCTNSPVFAAIAAAGAYAGCIKNSSNQG